MQGPTPQPTPETQPYWEGTARGELVIQRCNGCRLHYFYPRPFCPECGSADVEWRPVSGRATLSSYVINQRPLPPFEADRPMIIALVELEEGPRMMSNIVGVAPDPALLELDAPLEVAFVQRGEHVLPVFRLAEVRA